MIPDLVRLTSCCFSGLISYMKATGTGPGIPAQTQRMGVSNQEGVVTHRDITEAAALPRLLQGCRCPDSFRVRAGSTARGPTHSASALRGCKQERSRHLWPPEPVLKKPQRSPVSHRARRTEAPQRWDPGPRSSQLRHQDSNECGTVVPGPKGRASGLARGEMRRLITAWEHFWQRRRTRTPALLHRGDCWSSETTT